MEAEFMLIYRKTKFILESELDALKHFLSVEELEEFRHFELYGTLMYPHEYVVILKTEGKV